MRYLSHGNWHVREGSIYLVAHCVITQPQMNQNMAGQFVPHTPDSEIPLALNSTLIQEFANQI
jgi:hypothetical protein